MSEGTTKCNNGALFQDVTQTLISADSHKGEGQRLIGPRAAKRRRSPSAVLSAVNSALGSLGQDALT